MWVDIVKSVWKWPTPSAVIFSIPLWMAGNHSEWRQSLWAWSCIATLKIRFYRPYTILYFYIYSVVFSHSKFNKRVKPAHVNIYFPQQSATEPFAEQAENTIRVNFFGTLALCDALFPLLRPHARVGTVSSCVGHLPRVSGDEPAAKALRDKLASPTLTRKELCDLMNQFVQ